MFVVLLQVHVLGVGLAVHEKLVHPEMRPLHKKLIDQFQMMRSSLCHVSQTAFETAELRGQNTPTCCCSDAVLFVLHDPMKQRRVQNRLPLL